MAFVDVTDPNYKPEGNSGFVDVTDPNYKAPAPRSALGEIGTALKRGALVGLPEMAGQAVQYVTTPGGTVHEFAKSVRESAEARGRDPNMTLRPAEHGAVVNALAEGAEMAPSVLAPVAVGAGALAALPVELPALAATGVVAGMAALPFAGAAGQQTKEKGIKAGLPEDEASAAARLTAGLTLGTQTALGMIGGQLFGRGARIFGQVVREDGAKLAEQTLKDLTGRGGVLKPFAKQLPVSAGEAVVAGGAQAAGSAAVEKSYGIDNTDPWEAAIQQAPAMLGLSAILSPLGLTARAVRANSLSKRAEALESKDTSPKIRDQLATQYFIELNKVDPAAAATFAKNAELAIKNQLPLVVDRGLFVEGAVQPPAPPPPPVQGVLRLPSPYDFVAGAHGVGRDADAVRAATGEAPPALPLALPAPARAPAIASAMEAHPDRTPAVTEVHGPSPAELAAARRDEARAAEENRRALVDTHAHVVEELKAAGVEPVQSLSFPEFRKAMEAEAKKAGLKPDQLSAADYRDMWAKHQEDVMNENFTRAQKHAFQMAEESRSQAPDQPVPKGALATALEDAIKHQQIELAYREREKQRDVERGKIATIAKGEQLAAAAERGEVPSGTRTVPATAERVVQELRAVKPKEQAMPPRLIKELSGALTGKESLEDQLATLKALRDSKKPESATYELLDKLYARLGGDDALQATGTAKVETPVAPASNAGRPKGTTDDRHTIGPPNEVGELLPYTRTLSQAREGAGGIFGEKQWWQDLAWAVRNPTTKIGKELLENGKITDEQMGQAIARDDRYQRADVLLEEMRKQREERLRQIMLADAQPEAAKEILKAKDLVNIFGGEEGDYVFDRKLDPKVAKDIAAQDHPQVRAFFMAAEGRVRSAAEVLEHLRSDTPEVQRTIQELKKLNMHGTPVVFLDEILRDSKTDQPMVGRYFNSRNMVLLGRGGANPETLVHELVHAATVNKLLDTVGLMESVEKGGIRTRDLTDAQLDSIKAMRDLFEVFDDVKALDGASEHYGATNLMEFVAEVTSNKEFQDFIRSRSPERGLWTRFIDAVKRLLGFKPSADLLGRAMELSEAFYAEPAARVGERPSIEVFKRSPRDAADQTDLVLNKVAKLGDTPLSIKTGFTRAHLAFTTLNHIRQVFKDVLPGEYKPALDRYGDAKDRTKQMVEERNRAALEVSRQMSALADKAPGLDTKLYRLMGEATRFGIFPERELKDQPWKAKEATPERIRKYNELRTIYESNPDLQKAYDAAAEYNKHDYDRIYATVARNIARYSEMPRTLWEKIDVTKGRSAEVQALEQWLLTNGSDEQRVAMRGALAQYREKQQGPYFHLGRNGSYFTRFTLADTPAARAAYEKEFGISPLASDRVVGADDRHVFARFEEPGEWKAVSDKLNKLREAGHLDPEMQSGQLETMIGTLDSSAPSFIRGLLRNIEADARLDPDQKRETQDILRRLAVEMLPETSASKAFAQRKGVAGYDVDMNRSFVKRAAATAYFVAHNSIRPEIEDSLLMLKRGVQSLQDATSPHYNNDRGLVASALQNEIKQRHANEMLPVKTPILDNVSALSHSFYLAANPAFFMMKTLQPWQLALPQLGARHGFVSSFKAMTKATATALGIIKDTIGDGWQRGQWKGVLDPDIVIDRSRANQQEKAFLKELIAAGGATFTQAHDMGHIAAGESPNISNAVKAGNASLHYSEALDRMTAGLAAFNLEMKRSNDFQKATQYGIQMVKNSLYDYNQHNRGRMFSKQGMFGPATPLLTQFAQYQIQTLELLGRLTGDAFGKISPDMLPAEREQALAEKGEARKALAGIMATTMVLAGTMGLPAVTVLTAAYNNLFGTKDNPADAQTDFRNFLADTFGKDAGEIIAHGALRAVGSDLGAGHLGFQDIIPFSRFLADRRKLQDRFDSGAMSMLGPAVGAASGAAYGLQSVMQGRYMKGLEQMLPSGLKGVAKAADLAENGVTDLQGNKLPIDVNSWDVFNQLLNSTPSKVAEQKEAQRGANTNAMLLKERSMALKENFANAAEKNDGEAMKTLIDEIVEFNKANPDYAIRDLTGMMRQRAIERAVAEQTNVEGHKKQLPRLAADARFANVRGMP